MSQAILAKTAKQRASIALRMLRGNTELRRGFDDCFEMGDGDEVLQNIVEYVKRAEALKQRIIKTFSADALRKAGL